MRKITQRDLDERRRAEDDQARADELTGEILRAVALGEDVPAARRTELRQLEQRGAVVRAPVRAPEA